MIFEIASLLDQGVLAERIIVRFYSSANLLVQISKIRAFKLLWANVLDGFNKTCSEPTIESHVSSDQYVDDPYQNIMRASSMALSSVLAGISSLIIDDPDLKTRDKLNSSFFYSINIHHILQQESFLDKVVDPCRDHLLSKSLLIKLQNLLGRFFKG